MTRFPFPILTSLILFPHPTNCYIYSENYTNQYHSLYSLLPPENECEPHSKRQRACEGFYTNHSSEIDNELLLLSSSCNNVSINPPSLLSPDILSPFDSSFASGNNPIPMVFSIGSGGGCGGSEEMTNVKRGGSGSTYVCSKYGGKAEEEED